MMARGSEYNGWKNYETWNVVLWLMNEYPLYRVMLGYTTYPNPFLSLRRELREAFGFVTTKDGVSLWETSLDVAAINEAIREA